MQSCPAARQGAERGGGPSWGAAGRSWGRGEAPGGHGGPRADGGRAARGDAGRRAAAQTRRHRISDAKKAAEELGISLVAPLGALLLPAFVLLGLVPIVIHMFAGILGGV